MRSVPRLDWYWLRSMIKVYAVSKHTTSQATEVQEPQAFDSQTASLLCCCQNHGSSGCVVPRACLPACLHARAHVSYAHVQFLSTSQSAAALACTRPQPKELSSPAVPRSRADCLRAQRMTGAGQLGCWPHTRAATADT